MFSQDLRKAGFPRGHHVCSRFLPKRRHYGWITKPKLIYWFLGQTRNTSMMVKAEVYRKLPQTTVRQLDKRGIVNSN